MREKEVNPGQVISTLLDDINAWKGEDILPDEHKQMLANAEALLLKAEIFHKRYQTSSASLEAKRRNRSPQAMITRYRREVQDHAYQRDDHIVKAEDILADIIAQIEQLAEGN